MEIRHIEPSDRERVERFLARLPESDRTFFKEDVQDPRVLEAWSRPGVARLIAVLDGDVVGYFAVAPLHGGSSHVGEVRVVVDPGHRGRGVGRLLARRAVLEAIDLGLTKMMVEVTADQEHTIRLFESLGFSGEALFADHVRDGDGNLQDLLVLAHSVDDSFAGMLAAGLADEVGT